MGDALSKQGFVHGVGQTCDGMGATGGHDFDRAGQGVQFDVIGFAGESGVEDGERGFGGAIFEEHFGATERGLRVPAVDAEGAFAVDRGVIALTEVTMADGQVMMQVGVAGLEFGFLFEGGSGFVQKHGEDGRLFFRALKFIALLPEHESAGRGGEPGVGEEGLALRIIGGVMEQARGARGQAIASEQRGADGEGGEGTHGGRIRFGLAGQTPPEAAGLREAAAAMMMGGEGGGAGGVIGGQTMRVTDHDLFVAQFAGQFGGEHGQGQFVGMLLAEAGQVIEGFVFAIGLPEQSHDAKLHGWFIDEAVAFEHRDGAGGLVVAFAQVGQGDDVGGVPSFMLQVQSRGRRSRRLGTLNFEP